MLGIERKTTRPICPSHTITEKLLRARKVLQHCPSTHQLRLKARDKMSGANLCHLASYRSCLYILYNLKTVLWRLDAPEDLDFDHFKREELLQKVFDSKKNLWTTLKIVYPSRALLVRGGRGSENGGLGRKIGWFSVGTAQCSRLRYHLVANSGNRDGRTMKGGTHSFA